MSDLKNIFDISGRAMSAQLVRLNTIASNLANAGSMEGSREAAYKAIRPVFETEYSWTGFWQSMECAASGKPVVYPARCS